MRPTKSNIMHARTQTTRITVQLIVQLLANVATESEILNDYPDLIKEDIKAALLYASECLGY